MKLLIEQKTPSLLPRYEVLDESGVVVYEVKKCFSLGYHIKFFDANGSHIATVKQNIFNCIFPLFPKYKMYICNKYLGQVAYKGFPWPKPKIQTDYNGWKIDRDLLRMEYEITDNSGNCIANIKLQDMKPIVYALSFSSLNDALCLIMHVFTFY